MLAAVAADGGYALGLLPTDLAFRAAQQAGTSILDTGSPALADAVRRIWGRLLVILDPPALHPH